MNREAIAFWTRAIDTLGQARALLPRHPDGSASRAYYAAFYAVSALFASEGRTFTKHSAVETAVHKDLVKTGRLSIDLGRDYSSLMKARSTGDYGVDKHVTLEKAFDSVAAAARVLAAVHAARPDVFASPV